MTETVPMKEQAKKILGEGSFKLHTCKWHSNAAKLESDIVEDGESTYAKERLGTKLSETKLLGLGDTLSVAFPQPEEETTRRVVYYEPWPKFTIRWDQLHLLYMYLSYC